MGFKQVASGEWYFFKKATKSPEIFVKRQGNIGFLLFNIYCPKELIGKRVRLKLEIVGEQK